MYFRWVRNDLLGKGRWVRKAVLSDLGNPSLVCETDQEASRVPSLKTEVPTSGPASLVG